MKPIVIDLPEAPGQAGVQEVIRQIKHLADPDPWAASQPIIVRGTPGAMRLAHLLRWDRIPGVLLAPII